MTDFKNREDYERWKTERSGGGQRPTREGVPAPPPPAGAGPAGPGMGPAPPPSGPPRSMHPRMMLLLCGVFALIVVIFLFSTRASLHLPASDQRAGAAAREPAKEWPEVIQHAQKAVVLLKAGDSIGSGFFFNDSGDILTNHHVIRDNETVRVQLQNGRTLTGRVTMRGKGPLDLAIVRVTRKRSAAEDLPALRLADWKECMQGQEVVSIGSPLGLESSAAKGIVSNCNRNVPVGPMNIRFIQTDTPSNPGNSGGPLINRAGEVVGIMTLKVTGFNIEGMNFAIDSRTLRDFYKRRFEGAEVQKALAKKLADAEQASTEDMEMVEQNLEFMLDQVREVWEEERKAFQDRVLKARESRKISALETMALLKLADEPPDGYLTIEGWLKEITVIMMQSELTTEGVRQIIKKRFPI